VEAVTRFNHTLWVASLHHLPLEDLHRWKIIVNHIEVFILVLIDNFLIDLAQIVSSICGELSDSIVAVEPTPARTDFQAVEEVIYVSISDIEWMCLIVQVFV
jgi:hypothetical protein